MNKVAQNVGAVHTHTHTHTSNLLENKGKISKIRVSHFRSPTSNKAITLIALVITIIVLLILAGVTISMLTGETGILGKANNAKEQTQLKTAEETIQLSVLDNRTLKSTGDASALNNKNLKGAIAEKLRNLGYSVAEDNNTVTYYEEKTIKIEDYLDKEDNQTKITAQMVSEDPETYYGKSVDFTSENGQSDWKIFYSDGTHIFLITGDYVKAEDAGRIDPATGMTAAGYNAYWTSIPELQNVDSTVLTRFKAAEYVLQDIQNSKYASTLLNANNWKKYLDKENGTGNAEYAIGSPTIEMWMDSWNNLYEDVDGKLYRYANTNTAKPGYNIGTTADLRYSYYLYREIMSNKKGYENKLYYPQTKFIDYSYPDGYWLASPAADADDNIFYVCYDGRISAYDGAKTNYSMRPVVCLKSGIAVSETDSE